MSLRPSRGLPVPATQVAARAGAPGVPGRMQRVLERDAATPLAIVDYAHTPDALERALEGARSVTPGRLISVFGAGGDRDTGKGHEDYQEVAGTEHHFSDPEELLAVLAESRRP